MNLERSIGEACDCRNLSLGSVRWMIDFESSSTYIAIVFMAEIQFLVSFKFGPGSSLSCVQFNVGLSRFASIAYSALHS